MVYPMVLIVIMFISISLTAWNLIPEIQATYALFQHETPNWLLMLATLREHFFWLILAMCLATLLPIAVWFWRRGSVDSTGLPRLPEKRLRLQSLASRLASIQIAGSLPLSEVVPRCLTAMGVDQTKSTQAFEDLQARRTLEPLPVETSMLLGSLHGGIIDRDRAIELLDVVSDQFEYQAEVAGGRDARWLPALVAVIVFVVTVATYGLLVYLPWIQLMHRIGQP